MVALLAVRLPDPG